MTFSVATFGSLPVSYQWLENGTNLSDGGNLFGSSSRTLTLTNLGVADAALYSVVVSNAYGAVTSAVRPARSDFLAAVPDLRAGGSDRAGRSDGHVQRGGRRGRPRFPVARERDQCEWMGAISPARPPRP